MKKVSPVSIDKIGTKKKKKNLNIRGKMWQKAPKVLEEIKRASKIIHTYSNVP